MNQSIEQLKADIRNNKYTKTELKNLIFLASQVIQEPNERTVTNGHSHEIERINP